MQQSTVGETKSPKGRYVLEKEIAYLSRSGLGGMLEVSPISVDSRTKPDEE